MQMDCRKAPSAGTLLNEFKNILTCFGSRSIPVIEHVQNEEMMKSTKKAEATSARILDVALDLFRRGGFEQTTMRGIAAEAGVSLGSAYYYFESKEHLVMAFYGTGHRGNGTC